MESKDNKKEMTKNEWREPILRAEVNSWLKKHGLRERPRQLSQDQKKDLREIFTMLDADGSGALDSDEIIQAFKLINMPTSKSKIVALMGDVLLGDEEAELDYDGFELLMTRRINDTTDDSGQDDVVVMPFHEIANAFRRKKTLEAFMKGGQERQQIIDSEYFKQRKHAAKKRWRMPGQRNLLARMFSKDKKRGLVVDSDDPNKRGNFEDKLNELKLEVEVMQEEAEASSRVLEIFTASSHFHSSEGGGNSFESPGGGWERVRSKLKSSRRSGGSDSRSSVFLSPDPTFRPNTCPSYLESKTLPVTTNLKTGMTTSNGPPSPDYLPPLTPAPRALEQEFEDVHEMARLDSVFDSLKMEEVEKMRPQTSAAVDASEIRYAAYWRACNKEFFDPDIVQAKAQIVLAKVKPPKAEVNPWAVGERIADLRSRSAQGKRKGLRNSYTTT
ncbi:hypothetical protein HOP50_16g77290 [Chloropicon primus]|uniref:EF-hand domain-containing protein n=1 Tax=Chloropicon primus TaxID=1764295 RepID=A0A5B8MX94_9CHLO|nr:hypothetical protein A3770_16p77010 [Chloropicon primus]UPR04388.1 hypothetical protein HOP50_16g77290 [Chloropicon primus]|eukprot:QDZ25183.1 hypothetical protein A3770_16p77010 [Chloropicon primus]